MKAARPLSASGARVWRLPADVDTDALAPGHAMKHGMDTIARHCLETLRPDFAGAVRRGDVIVAGANFGIGSSREQAASVLVALGVAAVIAPSFGGLYFRNAFNVGLLLLTCDQAGALQEGERIAFDAAAARITRASGEPLVCEPIAPFLLDMAGAGGLLAQLEQRLSSSSSERTPHEQTP
jgi:3-isopropylmalate/(R)-2-methylmalate dehydratase small subunit